MDHEREMTIHVDLEGYNTYLDPLEGEDEENIRSIMKSLIYSSKDKNLGLIHYNEVSCHSRQIIASQCEHKSVFLFYVFSPHYWWNVIM